MLSSLLSITVHETLFREIRSRCPGEQLCADLALVEHLGQGIEEWTK